jgi:fructoselysine 6-kinase
MSFVVERDLVHNTILGGTIPYLARFKQARGLISFDYSDRYDTELLEATLAYIDIAFFSLAHSNGEEVKDFASRVYEQGPRLVVLTRGSAGSLVFDGEQFYAQPALQVEVVDTLGAGDAFIGRFLASYMSGQPLMDCLGQATEAAAQTCTHLGAWLPRVHSA